jgi:formiminotetrahydrofolate cyclodeaminase
VLDTPGMSALADRSLGQLLEQVAAESPSPGGGSSCALACALAAGLVQMAAAFTLARGEYAERHERMAAIRERAGELREEAVALAERELHVYRAVLDALRLPEDDPARAPRLDAALSDAADSPLAVARAAAEIAPLAAEVAQTGNRNLRGDAISGALLAEAACAAAARLAEINLAGRPSDPRREEAAQLPRRALAARLTALSTARDV